MSGLTDVHSALSVQLGTLGVDVAHENAPFTPTSGENWIREKFAPAPMTAASLGTDGYNRQTGVFFVDIFTPAGLGWQAADDLFAQVLAAFPRGAVLAAGVNTLVRIERTYRSAGIEEDAWYHVPASMEFRADLPPA